MSTYWLEQRVEDVPEEDRWLLPNELTRLAALKFPKRRADWRLGRWTAKIAVAEYLKLTNHASAGQDIEIRPASSGAPEVFIQNQPASVCISLSHCRAIAACAVGPDGTLLGCDLEFVEPRSDAFVGDYFTEAEQKYIGQAVIGDRDKLVTLLWSGKESALKAMRAGLRLDTRSVSVELGDDRCEVLQGKTDPVSQAVLHASSPQTLWSPMRVSHENEQVFGGWWRCDGELARTIVSIPAAGPPCVLDFSSPPWPYK